MWIEYGIVFAKMKHGGDCDTDASELLAIIDNLSKRVVKKYSRTEILQQWSVTCRPEGGFQTAWETNASRDAFLECARFLGALEEK